MKLNEIVKICLLALASRYPESVVEINEAVFGHQSFWTEACTPIHLLELLQTNVPQLLYAPACLVLDAQKSAIYLVEQSQDTPAFWVYRGGYTPTQRAKHQQAVRMAEDCSREREHRLEH
jgi:hypothetical protein